MLRFAAARQQPILEQAAIARRRTIPWWLLCLRKQEIALRLGS
jgi:hypothetical protein